MIPLSSAEQAIQQNPHPKLQTFLAHAGVASRRKSEELIVAGKVLVNGEVAKLGQRVDPQKDLVTMSGKKIGEPEQPVVFLIDKPVGIISTTSDELGRQTVVDFLQAQLRKDNWDFVKRPLPRLYPIGRLDQDSEGLMILTNDGALAQKMTHPSFEVPKTYRVTVVGYPTEKALAHLARGVQMREGTTAPANVEVVESDETQTVLNITIHEGWNHQVKRMLERVGYDLVRLVRIQMGEYRLTDLGEKKWKEVLAS